MSWNPATGLVYRPAQNSSSYYSKADEFDYRQGVWNTGLGRTRREDRPERPELTGPRTVLLALDPITNIEAWRVVSEGAHGGTMSTGGNLVFPGLRGPAHRPRCPHRRRVVVGHGRAGYGDTHHLRTRRYTVCVHRGRETGPSGIHVRAGWTAPAVGALIRSGTRPPRHHDGQRP